MASVIDVCNLALASIGHRAEVTAIDPADGSKEAALCNTFYPIARDAVLIMREWSFTIRRVTLSELGTPPDGWDYSYAAPSSMLRALNVYEDGVTVEDGEGDAYVIENDATHGQLIYTNTENAMLRYQYEVTDTTTFSPNCINAIGWQLASHLAGPLTKSMDLAAFCRKQALITAGEAGAQDANQMKAQGASKISKRYPVGQPRRSTIVG